MANIACVFAHPDDEAFGPGGTIAKLSQDNDVFLICCTDGDCQQNGLKPIRNQELLDSARILGVKQVFFLDFVDGSLSNNTYHDLAEKIKTLLLQIKPVTLLTFEPQGVSGHIDHIVITMVLNFLFPQLDFVKKILYFCMKKQERAFIPEYFVYMPPGYAREDVDEVIDVSDVWSTKVSAIKAHKSQAKDQEMILHILSQLPKEEWFLVRLKSD